MSGPGQDPMHALAGRLSAEAHARGDVYGWFESLYDESHGDPSQIPWADLAPHPLLVEWLDGVSAVPASGRALVVGCGLGDDAHALSNRGWDTIGFDVAPSAVAWCQRRFANGPARFRVADLLHMPAAWRGQFDLVFEANTLQVLTRPLQVRAMHALCDVLAPGGHLLVVARLRERSEPLGELPWPLCVEDLATLDRRLRRQSLTTSMDAEDPTIRRLRAVYERPRPAR